MLKRSGAVARAVVIAVAGLSFGLAGTIGESSAQSDVPTKDGMMMKDEDKGMMNKGQKSDGMKKEEMPREGMAPPKDDKTMMKDGPTMTKEKR